VITIVAAIDIQRAARQHRRHAGLGLVSRIISHVSAEQWTTCATIIANKTVRMLIADYLLSAEVRRSGCLFLFSAAANVDGLV
jgi:hypothetical protein